MTIYPFAQTVGANFTFNPILNGKTYQATVTWNVFGQRWYMNINDLAGNLIIATAVVSSDDQKAIESISWAYGVVTVTATLPHFMPLGTVANLNISGNTPNGYNGLFPCSITGPLTFTYLLSSYPGQQVTLGYFGGLIDLSAGLLKPSMLAYYANSNQFVTSP